MEGMINLITIETVDCPERINVIDIYNTVHDLLTKYIKYKKEPIKTKVIILDVKHKKLIYELELASNEIKYSENIRFRAIDVINKIYIFVDDIETNESIKWLILNSLIYTAMYSNYVLASYLNFIKSEYLSKLNCQNISDYNRNYLGTNNYNIYDNDPLTNFIDDMTTNFIGQNYNFKWWRLISEEYNQVKNSI